MSLTDEVKEYRLRAGFTQQEMAASIALSRQAYTLLESGQRRWKHDQICQVFGALGYEVVAAPRKDYSKPSDEDADLYATVRAIISHIKKAGSLNLTKRVLMELSYEERRALESIVSDYLDAPKMRSRMVAVCKAITLRIP